MTDAGYDIERWIFIPIFSILFILYTIQALTELTATKPESRWTIKWTARRLGPLASILMVTQTIDASEVFGIWTKTNRVDYFTSYNCTACLVTMCMSALYSIMNANYVIVRERMSRLYGIVFFFNSVLAFLCGNGVVIYALIAKDAVPRYVFLFVVASIFTPSLVLFELNVGPLIRKLESFKKNPNANVRIDTEHTERAARSLQRLRVLTLIAVSLATAGMFGAAVSSLKTPLDPNPDSYEVSGSLFVVVQACALMIILYFVWVPVGCQCSGGKWLYEIQRRHSHSNNENEAVNIGSPTSARTGGGGNKPMGKDLNRKVPGERDADEELANAHFVAAGAASSSRTDVPAKQRTHVSDNHSTQHSSGASEGSSSSTVGVAGAPLVVEDGEDPTSALNDAHWRIGSVLGGPRPMSSSTTATTASSAVTSSDTLGLGGTLSANTSSSSAGRGSAFEDSRAAEPSRGFQQDMEEP